MTSRIEQLLWIIDNLSSISLDGGTIDNYDNINDIPAVNDTKMLIYKTSEMGYKSDGFTINKTYNIHLKSDTNTNLEAALAALFKIDTFSGDSLAYKYQQNQVSHEDEEITIATHWDDFCINAADWGAAWKDSAYCTQDSDTRLYHSDGLNAMARMRFLTSGLTNWDKVEVIDSAVLTLTAHTNLEQNTYPQKIYTVLKTGSEDFPEYVGHTYLNDLGTEEFGYGVALGENWTADHEYEFDCKAAIQELIDLSGYINDIRIQLEEDGDLGEGGIDCYNFDASDTNTGKYSKITLSYTSSWDDGYPLSIKIEPLNNFTDTECILKITGRWLI